MHPNPSSVSMIAWGMMFIALLLGISKICSIAATLLQTPILEVKITPNISLCFSFFFFQYRQVAQITGEK
jgi:hypothetical protein